MNHILKWIRTRSFKCRINSKLEIANGKLLKKMRYRSESEGEMESECMITR